MTCNVPSLYTSFVWRDLHDLLAVFLSYSLRSYRAYDNFIELPFLCFELQRHVYDFLHEVKMEARKINAIIVCIFLMI